MPKRTREETIRELNKMVPKIPKQERLCPICGQPQFDRHRWVLNPVAHLHGGPKS